MKLTVVHLSDIHFKDGSDPAVAWAHGIAASAFQSARGADACFVVVTGDIAYGGAKEQYQVAESFCAHIREALSAEGSPLVDVFVTPGNHDCVLYPPNRARNALIASVVGDPTLAE